MKFVRMMILALGLVSLAAASSFAAVPFLTTATTNIIAINAQTGLAGSVLYTPLVSGNVAAGEIINLAYQAQISFLPDISITVSGTSTAAFKEVFGAAATGFTTVSGAFTKYGVSQTSTTSGISVTVNQTSILISFANNVTFATSDYIKIDGVRLDTASMATAGGSTLVNLSNTTGQATASSSTLTVGTFSEPLAFASTPVTGVNTTTNAVNFFTNATVNGGQNIVTVTLNEVFSNAFETKTTYGTYGPTYSYTRVLMTLANIPTGMAISAVSFAGVNGATFTNGHGQYYDGQTVVTANPLNIAITAQNANSLQGLQVAITFGVTSGTTTLALNPGNISVTATLNPAGPTIAANYAGAGNPDYPYSAPLSGSNPYYFGQNQLHFVARTVSTSIPVIITPLTSNLLSVFNMAVRDTAKAGSFIYDTGIAISNLSGTNPSGIYPAGLAGTIKVSLYPLDGSGPKTFETSSDSATRPGLGLSSSGTLAPKATWVVLLSQLLTPATFSATADFRGFIRFVCNFQDAAGIAYLADGNFQVTAQGYPMLSDVPHTININVPTLGAATGTVTPQNYF